MKLAKLLSWVAVMAIMTFCNSSCSDGKTYAELLNNENMYVNNFLANCRVVNEVPADTVFEVGPDAPYYRLDEGGNMYMQVIDAGTPGNMATDNELLYFRYTRFNLSSYKNGKFEASEGNDAVLGGNHSFRYGNYELSSSYSYGVGIQTPLNYLPVDCQVNIVIKSQFGAPDELAYVIPYLYTIRYFRPKI